MKKILLISLVLAGLTGCDVISRLKYNYYLGYRGKMVCKVTAAADEKLPIDSTIELEKIGTNSPEVTLNGKTTTFRQLALAGKALNLQHLDQETGISQIIIIQVERGELLYNVVGIDNENLVSRTYRAQCQ